MLRNVVFLHRMIPQFSSAALSCLTLCDPRDCSTPGLPVHHQPQSFHKLMSIESMMSSNHIILSSPSPPTLSFPASGSFPMSQLFAWGGQSIGVSALASVLPKNIQDWFLLGWAGWIALLSKGLSRVFPNTTVETINTSALSFLYSPTLTSIHDYWKNHSFDYMDLCWQSYVSVF